MHHLRKEDFIVVCVYVCILIIKHFHLCTTVYVCILIIKRCHLCATSERKNFLLYVYVWLVCVACMSVSIQRGLLYVYQQSKVHQKQNARKIAQIVLFVSHTAEITSLIPYNIRTIQLYSAQQLLFSICV